MEADPVEEAPAVTARAGEPEAQDVDAFELRLRDCFDSDVQDELESLPVVPCDIEHTKEVFHLFDLPESDGEFPGADVVDAGAEEGRLGE